SRDQAVAPPSLDNYPSIECVFGLCETLRDGLVPALSASKNQPSCPSPWCDVLGPLYCREAAGGLVIGLRIAPKHANARGLIHGGVLMTLCDIAMGYAAAHCAEPPLTFTTAHVSTDFAGSAKVGEWL